MLTAALIAAVLFVDVGQVSTIAPTPAPATRSTRAEEGEETRRVCRLERATGSNLQQRVCRDVPTRAGAQDQQAREFMGAMQRVKIPEVFDIPTPGIGGVPR